MTQDRDFNGNVLESRMHSAVQPSRFRISAVDFSSRVMSEVGSLWRVPVPPVEPMAPATVEVDL